MASHEPGGARNLSGGRSFLEPTERGEAGREVGMWAEMTLAELFNSARVVNGEARRVWPVGCPRWAMLF